jgi:hypothetical protein
MINQKINYTHANPVKAKLVKATKDYYWSSFRSFYCQGDEPWQWIMIGGGLTMLRNCQKQ